MGYFAARSAPLGQVPPEIVTAVFYNFAPERVATALTDAWAVAGPEAALRAHRLALAALEALDDDVATLFDKLTPRGVRIVS